MGAFSKKEVDVESAPIDSADEKYAHDIASSGDYVPDEGAVSAETFVLGDGWYAKTQRLVGKFGVEQRGIERVPSDERESAPASQIGTMWLSANMVVSLCSYVMPSLLRVRKLLTMCRSARLLSVHWRILSSTLASLIPSSLSSLSTSLV